MHYSNFSNNMIQSGKPTNIKYFLSRNSNHSELEDNPHGINHSAAATAVNKAYSAAGNIDIPGKEQSWRREINPKTTLVLWENTSHLHVSGKVPCLIKD